MASRYGYWLKAVEFLRFLWILRLFLHQFKMVVIVGYSRFRPWRHTKITQGTDFSIFSHLISLTIGINSLDIICINQKNRRLRTGSEAFLWLKDQLFYQQL